MGILLGKTEHVAYDKYQWSFYLKVSHDISHLTLTVHACRITVLIPNLFIRTMLTTSMFSWRKTRYQSTTDWQSQGRRFEPLDARGPP